LLSQRNYVEATRIYRQVVELAPQNAQAFFNLGLALQGKTDQKDAIAAFEKARDLFRDQNNPDGVQRADTALQDLQS
jgi:tetratricopeptide (TPR) repeat protein